jgi:hypothetical protein
MLIGAETPSVGMSIRLAVSSPALATTIVRPSGVNARLNGRDPALAARAVGVAAGQGGRWRRRRSRLVTWTLAAAAAAALVVGVLVAIQSKPVAPVAVPPHANASALTMVPAAASTTLASTASISSYAWGTGIEMTCSYGMAPENSDRDGDEPGNKLAMVVVGRDGSHTRLPPG